MKKGEEAVEWPSAISVYLARLVYSQPRRHHVQARDDVDGLAVIHDSSSCSTIATVHRVLTTQDMMKKLKATIPKDSRHVRPTATIAEANCQVAALNASEIQ
jgi:hypothetical protein